jgi:TolB protein
MAFGTAQAQTTTTRIVFQSDQSGDDEIWIMDEDGTNQENLTNNSATDTHPSICPDGIHIVFVSDRDDASGDIFKMRNDGSGVTNLTATTGTGTGPAEEHPDCGRPPDFPLSEDAIVFSSPDGIGATNSIFRMPISGGSFTQLTDAFPDENHFEPAWCGDQIVFVEEFEGKTSVKIVDADGENERRIVCGVDKHEPSCNRPGTRLAFTFDNDIYRMSVCTEGQCCDQGGSATTQLTDDPAIDREARWSPGGLHIAFSSDRDGDFDVYTMDSFDGDPVDPLTPLNTDVDSLPDWHEVRDPN